MATGRNLQLKERIVAALAAGVAVSAAPETTLVMFAPVTAAAALTFPRHELRFASTGILALMLLIAVAAVAGLSPALVAAVIWRAEAELRAERASSADGSAAALLQRYAVAVACAFCVFDAPTSVQTIAWSLAALVMLDWIVRRLADWRIGCLDKQASIRFLLHQGVIASLLLFLPSPAAILAALCVWGLSRRARLKA
jgi:hypothetical protein